MLVSEQKPLEEILHSLEGEDTIFLLGCHGCAEASHTGGEAEVLAMKDRLEEAGKTISGWTVLDFLCQKALIKTGLQPFRDRIMSSDSALVMCCGVGVQATAAAVDKTIHPGCNTLSMGGSHGEWRGSERCAECGDCLLDYTGGICPITACTKSLVNGPCGGARDGRCEHQPDARPCGWHLIYERLQKLGRLDKLREIHAPRDYARAEPPKSLRSTTFWALEQTEEHMETEA
jgi:hypothetical protein